MMVEHLMETCKRFTNITGEKVDLNMRIPSTFKQFIVNMIMCNYQNDYFKSLMVNTLQFYIGGNFDNKGDISDFKKIEENFKILIKDFFLYKGDMGDYEYCFPELTDDLYIKEEFNRVPGMYGGFFYFLKLEDGKPILYAEASSRMDLEELYIIDETCYMWVKDGKYYEEISKSNIKRLV